MRKTLLRKSLCFAVLTYGIPESLEQGGAVCIGHWFACHGAQWLRFVAVLTTVHLHTGQSITVCKYTVLNTTVYAITVFKMTDYAYHGAAGLGCHHRRPQCQSQ